MHSAVAKKRNSSDVITYGYALKQSPSNKQILDVSHFGTMEPIMVFCELDQK